MSNKAKEFKAVPTTQPMDASDSPVLTPTVPMEAVPMPPPPNPKLLDVDKLQLDLAKSNRKTALANAQKALAENEVAELNYKYLVLQIYMKYGLTEADAISEDGQIVLGGALQSKPQAR